VRVTPETVEANGVRSALAILAIGAC